MQTQNSITTLSLAWHRLLGPNEEMMKCSRAQNKQAEGEGKRKRNNKPSTDKKQKTKKKRGRSRAKRQMEQIDKASCGN